jgi:hypothetical protein
MSSEPRFKRELYVKGMQAQGFAARGGRRLGVFAEQLAANLFPSPDMKSGRKPNGDKRRGTAAAASFFSERVGWIIRLV